MCYLFKLNLHREGSSYREDFINHCRDYINHTNLQPVGVEIGVYQGDFSFQVLNSWSNIKLFSIDCWENQPNEIYTDLHNHTSKDFDNIYLDVLQRSKSFNERSIILRKYSKQAVEMFEDNSLDFVYLDANHRYEQVKTDIEMWFPKVKSHGIISGHDFIEDGVRLVEGCPTDFGVQKAVKEFFNNQLVFHTVESYANWFHVK